MGKLVFIAPGKPAEVLNHVGGDGTDESDDVQLEDLHRLVGATCVSMRSLGTIPGSGRIADAWFDDEGLLKDDTVPNRQIGPATEVVGNILLCARDERGESLAFTPEEAETVRAHVENMWAMLSPDHPRPDPTIEVRPVHRE